MKSLAAELAAPALPTAYRPSVGIMLVNAAGQIWTGRRLPKWAGDTRAHFWQMPQGGIESNETPYAAAVRELAEETGILHAERLGEIPHWLTYELPDELMGVALKGRFRGQRQRWFAMRFSGSDDEINISPPNGGKAEFDAWRWNRPGDVLQNIVPFKRAVYAEVLTAFSEFTRPER